MKTIHFDSIDSTNAYLKREHASLEHLTFVDASFQSAGRGREERIWQSKENENLLFSVLIKEPKLLNAFSSLSIGLSYVVCEYLCSIGLNALIKWPNDVFVNDRKICGILLEGDVSSYIIIGVGLNVNQTVFPSDLHRPATSIKIESKKTYDVDEIKDSLYTKIEAFCGQFPQNLYKIEEFIQTHNYLINRQIEINGVYGKVINIDKDNSLIVETATGVQAFTSGEVHIL